MTDRKSHPELPCAGSKSSLNDDDKKTVPNSESGVFLSPQSSREPGVLTVDPTARTQLDSGYRSDLSESHAAPHDAYDASRQVASFYQGDAPEHLEMPDTILIGDSHTQDDDHTDGCEDSEIEEDGTETLRRCGVTRRKNSDSVDIPGVSSFHDAHPSALRYMDATPPRTYLTEYPILPTDTDSDIMGHHRYSTGCLSMSPVLIQVLTGRRQSQTGQILERGVRVTSGMLKASSSRAALAQRRKSDAPLPPLKFIQEHGQKAEATQRRADGPRLTRNRSQSAPDISSVMAQRKCAQKLSEIGDEFFADFPKSGRTKKAPKRSKTQSQSCEPHCIDPALRHSHQSSSYPGSGRDSHSSWWWQAIVQSIRPQSLPPHHEQPDTETDRDDTSH